MLVEGAHFSVRMRGPGGMHPSFASREEIAAAAHDEMESLGTARSRFRDPPWTSSSGKGKEAARVPMSFWEYAGSGLHAQWSLAAPPRDFMRLRMAIQTDINALGHKKGAWISEAIQVHDLDINSTELVEHVASHCLLEDLRFEVHSSNFQQATVCKTNDPAGGITAVLNKLEQLEKRLDAVLLDQDAGRRPRRVPPLCLRSWGRSWRRTTSLSGFAGC